MANREIKFRVWRSKWNEMNSSFDAILEAIGLKYCLTHDDEILMQFTGLKDKNGKDIYEGDILSDGEDGGIVTWCNELSCYKLETSDGDYLDDYLCEYLNWKIVGNIYENKEMFIGYAFGGKQDV